MRNNKKNNFGFTLVEVLFAISIFALFSYMGSEYIISGLQMSRINNEQEEAIKNARNVLDSLIQEIREARQSERGNYLLDTVEPQRLIFYSDIDNDGLTDRITYVLEGTDFKKAVIEPTGSPLDYLSANTSTTTSANYVNNQTQAIFTYYDTNNNLIVNPSANKTLIRLIKVRIVTNVTPTILPGDYTLEIDVQIRNLKDNL